MTILSLYLAFFFLTIECVTGKKVELPGRPLHDEIECYYPHSEREGYSIPDPVACSNAVIQMPRFSTQSPVLVHWPLIYRDGNCELVIRSPFIRRPAPRAASEIDWPSLYGISWAMWRSCYGVGTQGGQNSPPHTFATVYTHAWDVDYNFLEESSVLITLGSR
jgi:hypothetical protein